MKHHVSYLMQVLCIVLSMHSMHTSISFECQSLRCSQDLPHCCLSCVSVTLKEAPGWVLMQALCVVPSMLCMLRTIGILQYNTCLYSAGIALEVSQCTGPVCHTLALLDCTKTDKLIWHIHIRSGTAGDLPEVRSPLLSPQKQHAA